MENYIWFKVDWLVILKVLSKLEKEGKIRKLQYRYLGEVDYVVRFIAQSKLDLQYESYKPTNDDLICSWKVWCERGSYARNNSSMAV